MPADAATFPDWVTAFAWISLVIGFACAAWVWLDVRRRPQRMSVMNVVWPVNMLFGGIVWLLVYLRIGRSAARGDDRPPPQRSMRQAVAISTNHCGAGCTLGDIVGEFLLVLVPVLAVVTGYGWLFQERIFAVWVWDFVFAFAIGIAFQYFAIVPMRGLGFRDGLKAAVTADAASISAWQVGMYGTMAIAQFLLAPLWFGGMIPVLTPEFWFAMQVAMVIGFCTSYPVNWLLIRAGVKERM